MMPKRIGKIEPLELRADILFAKHKVDKCLKNPGADLVTWSSYLTRLVKQIVPVEE